MTMDRWRIEEVYDFPESEPEYAVYYDDGTPPCDFNYYHLAAYGFEAWEDAESAQKRWEIGARLPDGVGMTDIPIGVVDVFPWTRGRVKLASGAS
jgi:hypothetical protein